MTKFTYHRPTQTALKSSSLLTHISQWQYKVGFTTRITLSWPSTANSYKPYDLLSYGVTSATSWKNCTGTVQRAQVTPKKWCSQIEIKIFRNKIGIKFLKRNKLRSWNYFWKRSIFLQLSFIAWHSADSENFSPPLEINCIR